MGVIIRSTALLVLLTLARAGASATEVPGRLTTGAKHFDASEYAEALQFFSSVQRGPDGAWVDYYLGMIHLQRDEVDDAIDRLVEAVEVDPDSSLFRLGLGEAYVQKIDQVGLLRKMGFAKKARTNFEQAVESSPGDLEARQALIDYYLNAPSVAGGSHGKAEVQAGEMMKLDPAKGHLLMGMIHLSDDDWEAAAGEYRLAIDAGARSSDSYYQLGFALQQGEDYEGAFEALERAIEADPADLSAYYQIGRTAIFSRTNLDRAVECLSFYLEQPPQQGSPAAEHAHWRLGMVYELENRKELARAEYRAALEADPKHEEAKKALQALGRS